MIGRTISHYRILAKLGEGGMGVVYKAEDTKLDRIVALKFLAPHAVGSDEERTRFLHEAKAAAALNHPNICTIYEIDEWEGRSFIAMEYVEGESLKAKIGAHLMELNEAIDIVVQVTAGLREAHKKGIVHRDIKPANIMLTRAGQAKIMDFGLAKSPGRTQLTRTGTTVGTMAYMSPEQGRGETVDHRSDIWSLGVVLYETVTGLLPFRGDHEQAIMYSILNEKPRPLTSVRSGVPMGLEKVVDKCLEKEPSERYQHVDDLMVDLKRVATLLAGSSKTSAATAAVGTTPTKRSIATRGLGVAAIAVLLAIVFVAVYPRFFTPGEKEKESESGVKKVAVLFFENLGPSEDEYFANGITDAITARLAGIRGLGVISRQSTIQYKGSSKSIREIGGELGVDYILEGTVQRERPSDPKSRMRVIPQLVRVSDDMHVWAGTYDEDMTEVFRVQSEIAERVARELDVTLLESERRVLEEKPTENLEAYEYYLRGKDYASRRVSKEDTRAAARMYEKAVELDPGFAEAWAALTTTYVWLYWTWGEMGVLSKVKAAGDKAVRLDPDLPETQLAMGYIAYYVDADHEEALTHFLEVQRRRPSDDQAAVAVALVLGCQGKWEEHLSRLKSALAMNPRDFAFIEYRIALTYAWLRRYDEADRLFSRVISLAPDIGPPYVSRAQLHLVWKGDVESAGQILHEAAREVDPREMASAFTLDWSMLRILTDISAGIFDVFGPQSSGMTSPHDVGISYLIKAEISAQNDRKEQAVACYDSARVSFESAIRSKPAPSYLPYLRVYLGLAYAGLGLKDKAIEEGRRAVELMPLFEDALNGPELHFALAQIYAKVGEYVAAIDQLEILLSIPSGVSVPLLRLDPVWDPLRDHPRFQSLMEKYSGAGS